MSLKKSCQSAASCVALALVAFAVPQDARPAEQDELDAKIHKLMEVTGAVGLGDQMLDQMMTTFQQMPGLPPGFAEKFLEKADTNELVELVVPIYRKHLDEATIDALIIFAESTAGSKFYAAQPAIMREQMTAGQNWGQAVAEEVMQELQR